MPRPVFDMTQEQSQAPAIMIEVSPGELLDKLSILEIKSERIDDPEKLRNVQFELDLLTKTLGDRFAENEQMAGYIKDLKSVNEQLWDIEDDIRACEARKDFGETFIQLARSVYQTNDRRADIKKAINSLCGSSIVEEKSYVRY
jgi:hypothetical protein